MRAKSHVSGRCARCVGVPPALMLINPLLVFSVFSRVYRRNKTCLVIRLVVVLLMF